MNKMTKKCKTKKKIIAPILTILILGSIMFCIIFNKNKIISNLENKNLELERKIPFISVNNSGDRYWYYETNNNRSFNSFISKDLDYFAMQDNNFNEKFSVEVSCYKERGYCLIFKRNYGNSCGYSNCDADGNYLCSLIECFGNCSDVVEENCPKENLTASWYLI